MLFFCTSAQAEVVFFEDFSSASDQFVGYGSGCEWENTGSNATLITYFGDEDFAQIDHSGCLLPLYSADIISNSIDLSSYEGATLSFNHYFKRAIVVNSQGRVNLSTDGGTTWSVVFDTAGDVSGNVETLDISEADGASDVLIRFRFRYEYSMYSSYWGVDDVTVTADLADDDDTADDDDAADDDAADDDDSIDDDDTADDDTTDDDDNAADDDTADDDTTDDDDADPSTGSGQDDDDDSGAGISDDDDDESSGCCG